MTIILNYLKIWHTTTVGDFRKSWLQSSSEREKIIASWMTAEFDKEPVLNIIKLIHYLWTH